MSDVRRGWLVEVRYEVRGRWGDWMSWNDAMTLNAALRYLKGRASYERWQDEVLGRDNSDRTYRLRNGVTGEIIAPERFTFMFGRSPTSASQRAAAR
jgi:hypothetical protein